MPSGEEHWKRELARGSEHLGIITTQMRGGTAPDPVTLAALRSLFDYAAGRMPELLAEAQRLAAVPTKRTPPPRTRFLQRDEVESLFKKLPSSGPRALRDHTFLLFLYYFANRPMWRTQEYVVISH